MIPAEWMYCGERRWRQQLQSTSIRQAHEPHYFSYLIIMRPTLITLARSLHALIYTSLIDSAWIVVTVMRNHCWQYSPSVLSASGRPGTAPCPRSVSPASSACPGLCPWTASPGNCGEQETGHFSGTFTPECLIGTQKMGWGTYKSRKRSREISAVKTSRSPITFSGDTDEKRTINKMLP